MCVIRVEKGARDRAWEILELAAKGSGCKWFVAVDEDIYPSEPELLLWALCHSIHSPQESIRFQRRWGGGLDPSVAPLDHGNDDVSPLTMTLINAVRPWAYPPVALPAQEYMEKALERWQRTPGAPRLNLRPPWYGYELGYWPQEYAELARLIEEGDFIQAGELLLEYQTPLTDAAAEQMMQKVRERG
jgi:4-hydroxy-3-polyprenylbenzoate decarboxylase